MAFGLSTGALSLIGGGLSLASSLIGSDASQNAGQQASSAANSATINQNQTFDTINRQQQPWRQSGENALNALNTGLGLPTVAPSPGSPGAAAQIKTPFDDTLSNLQYQLSLGVKPAMNSPGPQLPAQLVPQVRQQIADLQRQQQDYITQNTPAAPAPAAGTPSSGGPGAGYLSHTFDANDLKTSLAPNYQFMLDQGLGATKNAANLQTGLLSGNTLKGVADYAEKYASNGYQQAFDNYTANQTNIYNRLANIAGLGQTAGATTAGAGTQLATGAANSTIAGGAAQAAGTVGSANATTGGLSNAMGWFSLPSFLNNSGGSGYNPNASETFSVTG